MKAKKTRGRARKAPAPIRSISARKTVRLLLARFPGQQQEHPESTDLYVDLVDRARRDPRVEQVLRWKLSDTPITMSRNRCLREAVEAQADIVIMLDADIGAHAGSENFYDIAMDFLVGAERPSIIGAPYCGPLPASGVYVFEWTNQGNPGVVNYPDLKLEMIRREDAARRRGIQEVAALPTGLIAIDMRAITGFPHPETGQAVSVPIPWFYYEWKDQYHTEKASTEDVVFTRNASLVGCPVYCAWNAWVTHHKLTGIERPEPWDPRMVADNYRDVMQNGSADQLMFLPPARDRLRE